MRKYCMVCASVRAIIHSLQLMGYHPVQSNKLYIILHLVATSNYPSSRYRGLRFTVTCNKMVQPPSGLSWETTGMVHKTIQNLI